MRKVRSRSPRHISWEIWQLTPMIPITFSLTISSSASVTSEATASFEEIRFNMSLRILFRMLDSKFFASLSIPPSLLVTISSFMFGCRFISIMNGSRFELNITSIAINWKHWLQVESAAWVFFLSSSWVSESSREEAEYDAKCSVARNVSATKSNCASFCFTFPLAVFILLSPKFCSTYLQNWGKLQTRPGN